MKGNLPTLTSWPASLALASVRPTAGDLRVAVGAAGDVLRVHGVRVDVLVAERLRDGLGGDDAFVARLVREPRRRGDVADRPEAGDVGAAHRVGLEEAAVHRHAQFLEPDILGVGDDPDRDDGVAEALLGRSCRPWS